MHSFISNFSRLPFLIRLLIFLLLIFVCYSCLLYFLPAYNSGAAAWQDNIIKIQRYVFSEHTAKYVVVGSSEMARVPIEKKSSEWANLGLQSKSSQTGLEIVCRKVQKGEKPRIVWIEMNNTLLKGLDQELVGKTAWWHDMPLLREYDRPDAIIGFILYNIKNWKDAHVGIRKDEPQLLNTRILKRVIKQFDTPLDEEQYYALLLAMKENIDFLRAQDVGVILCIPPNAPEIKNCKKMLAIRRICYEVYPPEQYTWQEFDWSQYYYTEDGVHLQEESADKFADLLVSITEQERI